MIGVLLKAGGWVLSVLGGGALKRVLASIDNATNNETERERARLEAVQAFAQAQASMMNGPGRWLLALFVVPLGTWFTAVIVYSILFCKDCAFPQDFTIAALPPPLDQWAGWIIMSMFAYGAAVKATFFKK